MNAPLSVIILDTQIFRNVVPLQSDLLMGITGYAFIRQQICSIWSLQLVEAVATDLSLSCNAYIIPPSLLSSMSSKLNFRIFDTDELYWGLQLLVLSYHNNTLWSTSAIFESAKEECINIHGKYRKQPFLAYYFSYRYLCPLMDWSICF